MKKNLMKCLLAGAVCWGLASTECFACTIPLPEPESLSNEYGLEVEYEGYDSVDDVVKYKVELEVEVHTITSLAQCQCALNLGSTAALAPTSFDVNGAIVGLRSDDGDVDLIPFEGFERDSAVESDVANLAAFNAGATPFGFSLDVSPFTLPAIAPGQIVALIFEFELSPDDFDEVNGSTIQFAAGSADPGHALSLFQGYQTTLALPSFGTINRVPEPSTFIAGLLGMVAVATRRGRTLARSCVSK